MNICTEGPALSFFVPGTCLVSERSALDHRSGRAQWLWGQRDPKLLGLTAVLPRRVTQPAKSLAFPGQQRGFKTVLGLSRGLQVMCVGQISQSLGMTEENFLRNASDFREHNPCHLDWEYLAGHALLTIHIS